MFPQWLTDHIDELRKRALADAGFEEWTGGGYRPDATAWAILALSAADPENDLLEPSRSRLAAGQLKDGRVSLSREAAEAFWPTPLAVLAWQGSPAHHKTQTRAVHFIINTSGTHQEKTPEDVIGHNPAIRGWSWVENTHSWVEPTALALIALRGAGHGNHPRVAEAVDMLLDRQLHHGGWNYGNTTVYGQELRPMPDTTGLALQALSGQAGREDVKHSVSYLKAQAGRLRTPLNLAWCLLGLRAWKELPGNAETMVFETLGRQAVYGKYKTSHLSMLILALLATEGLAV